ncbi:OmpH family outer membrane protein [Candidatus Similichlamydia epinepheli]|uniref:OmpH family outer membrane protein n=1 Tax=Candidatus Similichlamydia epinepheli TaxID=1903953 RepID=UPI000D36467F|nr:OmpH family outer membrane protein [Candidatus Similichlamydia epinepheli]
MDFFKKSSAVIVSVVACSVGVYLYLTHVPSGGCPLRRLIGITKSYQEDLSSNVQPSKSMVESSHCPIGVLNFESCVTGSRHGQRGTGLLDSANQKMREELKDIDEKIQSLQDNLQDENLKETMTEEARNELQKEWMSLRRARDERAAYGNNKLYRLQMELVQKLGEMITKASSKVCKKFGLKLLVSSGATHYHEESLNLTNEVIVALDEMEDFVLSSESTTEEEESSSQVK